MNLNHVLPVIIMVWALSRESNDSRTGVKLWNHVESVNYHTIKSVKIMAIADGSAEIWCICTLCTVNWHSQLPPNCCVHTELFPLQLSARNATHCFGNIRCSVARDRLQHCMQIISSGSWHKCQRIPSRWGQPHANIVWYCSWGEQRMHGRYTELVGDHHKSLTCVYPFTHKWNMFISYFYFFL